MEELDSLGYLKIANEADRITVASILYKNGYAVKPVRTKKNGKTYEYYVQFKKVNYKAQELEMMKNDC